MTSWYSLVLLITIIMATMALPGAVSHLYKDQLVLPGAVGHIYNGQYGTPWCCKSHL